jgi:hypothetical protein
VAKAVVAMHQSQSSIHRTSYIQRARELAFEEEVRGQPSFRMWQTRMSSHKVARFRQVNLDQRSAHHDALEFPDGKIVLVTKLWEGQHATVLQLPSTGRPATKPGEQVGPERASLIA